MCGIYGIACLDGGPLAAPELLEPMGRSLRHRGPDSRGLWQEGPAALGNERLRIVDLHRRADQPFHDPRTGSVLVCNGEIYNCESLRRRFAAYPYTSRSDVEVILPLYAELGAAGLAELDGMFGLAIWDQQQRTLLLARDRAGEKPLFYTRVGGELRFASEVQALLLDAAVSRELDETAIAQYLALGYVPEPRTALAAIRKIEAGTVVSFSAAGQETFRYWDPEALATEGDLGERSEDDLAATLGSLLENAVHKQMAADVPVGVFVSGGLDSTLLALHAAREIPDPLHTFVARFSASSYDESEWAARGSRLIGATHHEVTVDEASLAEALAAVTDGLAEPLADPALLPTYLLAREAKNHVEVVLGGEGADELFGGYPTYLGHALAPRLQAAPAPVRRALKFGVARLPASRRKVSLEFLLKRFLSDVDSPWSDRHLAWFGTGAAGLLAAFPEPTPALEVPASLRALDAITGAGVLDYATYLRDDLLVKMDRATMLSSLEARAPYLDRDLTAFALALPSRVKVRGLTTKWLLKKVARRQLPRRLVDRRKRGLSVPVGDWIDGALRPEVDRLLAPDRLRRQELLDVPGVEALLAEHRARAANHTRALWALVILQYWLEKWVPARAA